MTNPSVRETKRADELKPGDWLAAMQLVDDGDKPSEVLSIHPFADTDGPAVLLVFRAADGVPRSSDLDADTKFEIATKEELNAGREQAERAQRIADLRAFADWMEANPWAPMPNYFEPTAHLDERHIGGLSVAEGYAKVHEVADRLGSKAEERLADRTEATKEFGRLTYKVIAWHPDGRPTVPEFTAADAESIRTAIAGAIREPDPDFRDGPCEDPDCPNASWPHFASNDLVASDPTGLSYTRADDEPDVEVVPGRTAPHVGGVVDGGMLVDETESDCPPGGCAPNFCVGADDCRRDENADDAEPECTPECDALYTNITKTGRERRYHADNCPWARILADEDDR